MANKLNTETQNNLTKEIIKIQQRCVDTHNIIKNTPDVSSDTDNASSSALSYVEGIRNEILNSDTTINSDVNLITSQFLTEMKIKTKQVEEQIAFTKGTIHDTRKETERLQKLTKKAKEALLRPKVVQPAVRPEHLQKAKETFHMMKKELHDLIQCLFPDMYEEIIDVVRQLLEEKVNEESDGYIEITNDNFNVIELLANFDIVTYNPYNKAQVKFAG